MLVKINDNLTEFNSFLTNLKRDLCAMTAFRIEQQLEKDVDMWLHRNHYQRREDVGKRKTLRR